MFEKIQSADPIEDVSEMTKEYKEALMHLLLMQADSELSGAYGYVPWIMKAPSVQEKLIVANIVKDEVRHAKAVFGLLSDLGFDVQAHLDAQDLEARVESGTDIGTARVRTDKRVNIFYYPIETWTDFVMFNFCMDRGAGHQLEDVLTCSYGPWARVVKGIFDEEVTHIAHGDGWVKRLALDPRTHDECQETFNKWYLRTVKIFGSDKSTKNELYKKLGLKKRTNAEVRNAFITEVSKLATAFNLSLPGWYQVPEQTENVPAGFITRIIDQFRAPHPIHSEEFGMWYANLRTAHWEEGHDAVTINFLVSSKQHEIPISIPNKKMRDKKEPLRIDFNQPYEPSNDFSVIYTFEPFMLVDQNVSFFSEFVSFKIKERTATRVRVQQLDFERGKRDAMTGQPPAEGRGAYLAGFIEGTEESRANQT